MYISSSKFQLNDESIVLFFHTHFISLDPTHITFPLVTIEDYRAKAGT